MAVFGACLFLLGMGEGGGFPAATKAVAEWFPPGERSTAMRMINAGTAVGAVAAPPLIAIVLTNLNWVTGGVRTHVPPDQTGALLPRHKTMVERGLLIDPEYC